MTKLPQNRKAQPISAAEAAGLVKSGDWIDYGALIAQPDAFDRALAARAKELRGVKVRACLSTKPRAILEIDPKREHFHWYNWHFGGYDRKKHDQGICHYLPCNLGEIPDYYRRFIDPVDICVFKVCPADESGFFNLSAANMWHRAVASRAKVVIAEINAALPSIYGRENALHIREIDFVIEGDGNTPPILPLAPPTDADRAVARLIAHHIDDNSCLQIGIGAMPNAVCSLLAESGVRDLGVHTEMMTDGLVELYESGAITGASKKLDRGKSVFSFALGSEKLYRTLHRNPDFFSCPVDYTNLPQNIMRNDRVVSINSTTQIDLQGQASSESAGHRHISGTGGQLQFVRGAYASKGGKSFICLPSTFEGNGRRQSRIVLTLTLGSMVTTPRSDVMYVVTEFGIANLKGKSVPERAEALIALAHPDFRTGLERAARNSGLVPKKIF